MEKGEMATGTVRSWVVNRGFGFVRPDNGDDDIFVHASSIIGSMDELREGLRVKYEERPSSRHAGKFEAINVSLL
jgi:CspA family cold shock protein